MQIDPKSKRRSLYFWMFVVTAVLAAIGVLSWPLELAIYLDPDGTKDWVWNDGPSVSTESNAYWHYYSLRPLLFITTVTAVVSLVLYTRENKNNG